MNRTDIDNLEKIEYDRVDEVSTLVHAYNEMVEDLSESTVLLKKVERDKANLRATKEALEMLARTKQKRDSLQVRFDVQCAKIKYIHKKQKEVIK